MALGNDFLIQKITYPMYYSWNNHKLEFWFALPRQRASPKAIHIYNENKTTEGNVPPATCHPPPTKAYTPNSLEPVTVILKSNEKLKLTIC